MRKLGLVSSECRGTSESGNIGVQNVNGVKDAFNIWKPKVKGWQKRVKRKWMKENRNIVLVETGQIFGQKVNFPGVKLVTGERGIYARNFPKSLIKRIPLLKGLIETEVSYKEFQKEGYHVGAIVLNRNKEETNLGG